jgi:hypothetical protein
MKYIIIFIFLFIFSVYYKDSLYDIHPATIVCNEQLYYSILLNLFFILDYYINGNI